MIDHISLQVRDLEAASNFFQSVLEPIGLRLLVTRESTAGFGKKYPELWLNSRPDLPTAHPSTGAHVCLRAPSEDAVQAFHRIALELGGADDGKPGPRLAAVTTYYGAFIRDLDGNRIEAVTFPRN